MQFGSIQWLEDGPFALHRWASLKDSFPLFFHAFLYTLGISIGALILAGILGIIFGSLSSTQSTFLRGVSRVYVEFFQNTPLLIQVFFVYYGLPLVNIVIPVYLIGIICVGIYQGAYIAEVVRSGVQSVAKGQSEAAYSQGFSYWQTMFLIILPQAWRIMLPPLTNQVVNLIKNTSVIAIISGADIMFTANSWSSMNLNYVPAFTLAGLLYFILCFPLAKWARNMEEKNKRAYSR